MSRTTVPRRDLDRENAAIVVNSDVSKRQMTDEERKRIFGDTDKQQVKDGGVKQRLAAAEEERRQETEKAKQVKFDGRSSAKEPIKQEFLQWIADGKSIAAFERQLGMRTNAMYYWVKKWELTGIKPSKARELLGLEAEPVKQTDSKPVALISVSEKAYKDLKDKLVEYKSELANLTQIVDERSTQLIETTEDRDNWKSLAQKRETELNEFKQAFEELTEERDLLLAAIEGEVDRIKPSHDNVNHPAHYTFGGIETIDFIRAKLTPEEFAGYCKAKVLEYVSRATHKGGIEDLRKAGKYIEFVTVGGSTI